MSNARPLKRAIHLDFHTMPEIYDFNADWDAAAFAQRLQDAHVKYINTFAKCNTGFCYYPTKVGIPYPGMKGDMFGDLLRECHKRDIGVTAYFNIGIDQEGCRRHREWSKLMMQEDASGRKFLTHAELTSTSVGRVTCLNSGFGDYLKAMVREFIDMYPDVDGLFFDCLNTLPCYGSECAEEIRANGGDPTDPATVARHTRETNQRFCMQLKELAGDRRIIINSQPQWRTREYNSHIEIECLPNCDMDYEFFPAQAAYSRNIKDEVLYMTGRFVRNWGDFGGLKPQASLENDMWDAVMNGVGCSIGDHMHPAGIVDKQVYERVGKVYEKMEAIEPWTDNAKYQAEIGVVVPLETELFFEGHYTAPARMLAELKYTCDYINETMDFSRYRLIILPDNIRFGKVLEEKISAYIAAGGKVISTGTSALKEDADEFALPEWNMKVTGMDTGNIDYYQADAHTEEKFTSFRYAAYAPGVRMEAGEGAEVCAWRVKPYFDRIWDGFHAHYWYNPPQKVTDGAMVVRSGSVCHIAFELFDAYSRMMYAAHRDLLAWCIEQLMDRRMLVCEGIPVSARVTLTKKDNMRMLHVKSTYPESRGKVGVIEEHIYLPAGGKITVEGECRKAYLAPSMEPVEFTAENGKTTVTLPAVHGYALIVLE